jgi:hypothetical protein
MSVAGVDSVASEAPGWVYPSIITGSVMASKAVAGCIVCGPAPGISKSIVSKPGFVFAWLIASRSEPAPESLVLVTTRVEGRTSVPFPDRETSNGDSSGSSDSILKSPDIDPVEEGVNVTVIVQELPEASILQSFVWLKSAEPLIDIFVIVRSAVPVFETVTS